jgi:hypothetical protein
MKALLIYPRYPDTLWRFRYALKFVSRETLAPTGLLCMNEKGA